MSVHRQSSSRAHSVQHVLGLVDQHLLRNRFGAILFSTAVFFTLKLWSAMPPSSPQMNGAIENGRAHPMDPEVVEPLDRATVLANRNKQGMKGGAMKRNKPWKKCESELVEEDPAVMLKKFLDGQAALESQSELQTEDLKLAWEALSKLYTARGLHKEAFEAQKSARLYDSAQATEVSGADTGAELGAALYAIAEEEDELGALSFAQVGASYSKGPLADVQAAHAEAEVWKWLETFGQNGCEAEL